MADLLTTATLAVWTQNEPSDVADDPFAAEVIDKVSRLAQFLGGHPEWTMSGEHEAPFDVQMVVLQVAKRTYANPDQERSTTTGPISSTVLDVAAMLTELTDSERRTLTRYNPEGDPLEQDKGGLWVLHTTRDEATTLPQPTLFVNDDQQINMTPDKNAYPSWAIPMFSPGDPGDPANYVED